MSFPSRLRIPILVTAATLFVCVIGVRTELKIAEASIAAHRLQTQYAQRTAPSVAVAVDQQAPNPSAQ